jgi:hypothetical protein
MNTFSKPLFADDRIMRESLEAAVRTIPKVPMTRLGRWRKAKDEYEALKANHPDMWKKLFGSDDQDDDDEDEEYESDEDEDEDDWDEDEEALLTEEYTKFWDLSEKIINAGGMRMFEVMEVIKYGKKNHLKYEEGKFKVLYA